MKEIEVKRKLDTDRNFFVPNLECDKEMIRRAIEERKKRLPIKKISHK